jgi:hypothetical protein
MIWTPRPDSNGRAWGRSPPLYSTELRGDARRQQDSNLRAAPAAYALATRCLSNSAMPPGRARGRRGSRTPKARGPTRFRNGVPRPWQSFREILRADTAADQCREGVASAGVEPAHPRVRAGSSSRLSYEAVSSVAGRNRTCGAPRFRRALYRAELRPREGVKRRGEWARLDSNQQPLVCETSALRN